MNKGLYIALIYGISALGVAALPSASAAGPLTEVATISGCYDCLDYDTPGLVINNTTGGTLTNTTMTLYGYQGDNLGYHTTVNLGNLGAGSTNEVWGSLPGVSSSTTPHNLTAYDYDDEFIGTSFVINDPTCGGSGCVSGGGPQWYADTGNFQVTLSATVSGGLYDGQSVFAQFTPATNATGGFVGWEGLNPGGFSESSYDVHSGTITGDLANIYLGVAPPPGVPEPATWAMMLIGFGAIGLTVRRRRNMKVQFA